MDNVIAIGTFLLFGIGLACIILWSIRRESRNAEHAKEAEEASNTTIQGTVIDKYPPIAQTYISDEGVTFTSYVLRVRVKIDKGKKETFNVTEKVWSQLQAGKDYCLNVYQPFSSDEWGVRPHGPRVITTIEGNSHHKSSTMKLVK